MDEEIPDQLPRTIYDGYFSTQKPANNPPMRLNKHITSTMWDNTNQQGELDLIKERIMEYLRHLEHTPGKSQEPLQTIPVFGAENKSCQKSFYLPLISSQYKPVNILSKVISPGVLLYSLYNLGHEIMAVSNVNKIILVKKAYQSSPIDFKLWCMLCH